MAEDKDPNHGLDASKPIFVKLSGEGTTSSSCSIIPTPTFTKVEQDSRKTLRTATERFRVPEHYVHSSLNSGAAIPTTLGKYDLLVADQNWLQELNRSRAQPLEESLVEKLLGLFEVEAGRRTTSVTCICVLL